MFKCEKCGIAMVEDYSLTCLSYDTEIDKIITEDGVFNYSNLPDYLIFICRRCGGTKKVKLQTIITNLQNIVITQLLSIRLRIALRAVDKSVVDEAHGVSYCGICAGVIDDSGYCYNDVISQCVIRKSKIINV